MTQNYVAENEIWSPASEKAWAFTIKNNADPRCDYADFLTHAVRYGHINHVVQEKGLNNHNHIHGIITLPKNFLRKRLSYLGYHLHLTEITDERPWLRYLQKEQLEPTPYIDNTVYMF